MDSKNAFQTGFWYTYKADTRTQIFMDIFSRMSKQIFKMFYKSQNWAYMIFYQPTIDTFLCFSCLRIAHKFCFNQTAQIQPRKLALKLLLSPCVSPPHHMETQASARGANFEVYIYTARGQSQRMCIPVCSPGWTLPHYALSRFLPVFRDAQGARFIMCSIFFFNFVARL